MYFSNRIEQEKEGMRVIGLDNASIWKQLNRTPYLFHHTLANHPLFDIPRLLKLAKGVIDRGDATKFALSVEGDAKFNSAPLQDRLLQAIRRVDEGGIRFKLSSLEELDQDYDHILRKTIGEVEDLTGLPLRHEIGLSGITVFVASPNMVTPYHFDNDTNFLFQIRGEKDYRIFDPQNRFVLTENEIERFYAGNPMAGIYREEVVESGSTLFHLTPGTAVHHPPLAPHMVTNGNNVSVSVSMWFALSPVVYRARIYQANYCLRRLGFKPLPPGKSRFRDKLKNRTFEMLAKSNPASHEELLYSGMNRLKAPFNLANRMIRRTKSP
ncbi:MAG: cupin-like domain-containing protein [Methylocella sp.]|nr:MAG: transcription factor [Hyphomicrobiales bacterium]